jgi:hypothetical protein
MNNDYGGLSPPSAPFASPGGFRNSHDNLSLSSAVSTGNLSLSVNYLPSKFSASPIAPMGGGARKRKQRGVDDINIPKRGGGADAFKSGEARMSDKRLRWNRFKWILFVTNTFVRA